MTKKSSPVVFFGSGPVAAQSLKFLSENFTIEAIVTKPSTAGEMSAAGGGAPVHTVSTKTELDVLIDSSQFKSQLGVLIDFGIIVSQKVIDYFPLGIVNSHFSLLPQWRGADPITFSILSGQETTGVSLMLLTAGMDEGPVFAQGALEIAATTDSRSLTASLIELSDALLRDFIPLYLSGRVEARPQEEAASMMDIDVHPTYSRKLTKQDGHIDWSKPAEQIEREIRAYIEWPRSYTKLGHYDVSIRKAHVIKETGEASTTVFTKKSLVIFCGSDALSIDAIQPAGKKEMPIQAFLAGYKL